MKKRKTPQPAGKNGLYGISDGSRSGEEYGTRSYTEFLSNGFTDNEKVEAEEYFATFLDEK